MSIETLQAEESEIEAPDLVVDTEIEGAAPTGEGATDPGGSDPEPAPIVSFDEDSETEEEEAIPNDAPSYVKKTREVNREMKKTVRTQERELRELRAKVAVIEKPPSPALMAEPTLDDPDVEYDADKFKAKMRTYLTQEAQESDRKKQEEADEKKKAEDWNSKWKVYATERETLKGEAFEEAETTVSTVLSSLQQGIIIKATASPAKMVYALGMSPKKLAELAAITDPVRFAVEIGKLEVKMGSIGKRTPPNPETPITGTIRATSDSVLERLRAEAERTGDNSKVIAYKRSLRK